MQDLKTERELLEEIRDLLRPVSAVYKPQYEELMRTKRKVQIDGIVEIVGRGAKRAAACRLMDGSRTRKEIAESSAIDSGDLSRLIKALRDSDLAVEDAGRPRLAVEPEIVWSD